jgi:hypothetical protein
LLFSWFWKKVCIICPLRLSGKPNLYRHLYWYIRLSKLGIIFLTSPKVANSDIPWRVGIKSNLWYYESQYNSFTYFNTTLTALSSNSWWQLCVHRSSRSLTQREFCVGEFRTSGTSHKVFRAPTQRQHVFHTTFLLER